MFAMNSGWGVGNVLEECSLLYPRFTNVTMYLSRWLNLMQPADFEIVLTGQLVTAESTRLNATERSRCEFT